MQKVRVQDLGRNYSCVRTGKHCFGLLVVILFCAQMLSCLFVDIPQLNPKPLSYFNIKFVPSGSKTWPPREKSDISRFRIVVHWPGEPARVVKDKKPDRPYIVIGKLFFLEEWYYDQNIKELEKKYVAKVGGDAVLVYEAFQTSAVLVKDRDSAKFHDVYHQAVELEVIRYTDRI